ncbi:hypothetical protein H5410_061532 [Solanum commersonii]|uniref:Uncharacterized protein n=1 Tax=Solanum commersonii TaxID=4109 RepID=A0A9J5W9Y0_SOLCO|nr:hypothetical protein H5410_061532 [Solanum commersonii]
MRKKRIKIGEDTDSHLLKLPEICLQLTTIAQKLGAIDALAADVAALKAQRMQNHHGKPRGYLEEGEFDSTWRHQETYRYSPTKMEFPKYEGGDTHGWILKEEKYFQNYQTPHDCKVDMASIYLEGDALDLFAWINSERTIYYWDELIGQQLTTMAPKSRAIDALATDVAALKAQRMQNHHGKPKVYLEEGEVDSTWRH